LLLFIKFEHQTLDEDHEVDDFICHEMCSYWHYM